MITIMLADDHAVTRIGIKSIIELNTEIRVIYEASNGKEILKILEKEALPDIIIIDIQMPVMNGYDSVKVLHKLYPTIKIIVFSFITEQDAIINMISQGVSGYITKSSDPSTLAEAILSVYSNGFYLGKLVKKEYFKTSKTMKNIRGFMGKYLITEKELAFLKLASSNLSYIEIATLMEVQPKTLENYRDSLFRKLDINNRAALALFAFKNGLVD